LIGIFDSKQFHLKASLGGLNKKYSYPSFGPNVFVAKTKNQDLPSYTTTDADTNKIEVNVSGNLRL
jgi:hypothetical protein